jgi:hypothetical protein
MPPSNGESMAQILDTLFALVVFLKVIAISVEEFSNVFLVPFHLLCG